MPFIFVYHKIQQKLQLPILSKFIRQNIAVNFFTSENDASA